MTQACGRNRSHDTLRLAVLVPAEFIERHFPSCPTSTIVDNGAVAVGADEGAGEQTPHSRPHPSVCGRASSGSGTVVAEQLDQRMFVRKMVEALDSRDFALSTFGQEVSRVV